MPLHIFLRGGTIFIACFDKFPKSDEVQVGKLLRRCGHLNAFGPHKLIGCGTLRRHVLVGGRGWMTQACNSDLEAGGHTFNLGYTSIGSVSLWVRFEVFLSSFIQCDSQGTSCCL